MVGVARIKDKITENRLKWFEHICRRPIDAIVRKSDMIISNDNTRGRGRLKLILGAVVKNDMIGLNLSEHLALNRA